MCSSDLEAHANAADALIAALGGYPRVKRRVPRPSPAHGRPTVVVPLLQAAKLALHDAMLEQGVGNSALARRLGVQEGEVRRMLDLDHQTKIGSIEKALAALGRRVVAEVQLAA